MHKKLASLRLGLGKTGVNDNPFFLVRACPQQPTMVYNVYRECHECWGETVPVFTIVGGRVDDEQMRQEKSPITNHSIERLPGCSFSKVKAAI